MKRRIEGFARSEHTEGDVKQLSHHGADNQFCMLAV